jgi:pimeloyl-ACP methyl ester carboxylesterase
MGFELYYQEEGGGVPILLVPPAGSTASTWGSAPQELARIGRVISYDRRGYARSGGEPVRSISTHTADAAAILELLRRNRSFTATSKEYDERKKRGGDDHAEADQDPVR